MIIFVNERNEIKDVNTTKDETLTAYEITDNDQNPFLNWNVDKICCYRVTLTPEIADGEETGKYLVTMMTPYIDSRIIEPIVWLREQIKSNSDDIAATDSNLLEIQTALCDLSVLLAAPAE